MIGIDDVIEVAADLFAGDIASVEACEWHVRDGHGHEPLLDGGGDRELLLISAGCYFGLHQAGVFDQRCSFYRDGAENVVADAGDVARSETRVHVQRADHLSAAAAGELGFTRGLNLRLVERNTDHGAQVVGDDALPPLEVE